MKRVSRRLLLTGAGVTLLCAVACRAIIGVNPVTYEPVDSGSRDSALLDDADGAEDADDSGDDASGVEVPCTQGKSSVLFRVAGGLSQPFATGGQVFALVSNKGAYRALYSGFVGCPETGCDGGARVWPTSVRADAGVAFGTASASDAGVFFTLTSGGGSVDASLGSVQASALDGGSPRTLAAGLAYPYVLSASGGDLYWSNDPSALSGLETLPVWEVWHARASGNPSAAVFFSGSAGSVVSLFEDAKNVYALAQDSTQSFGLFVCPRSGCPGAPSELVHMLPMPEVNQFTGVDSFASDGTSLFHASIDNGTITQVSLTSGDETILADGVNTPSFLTTGGGYVYWATADGDVQRLKADGSGSATGVACSLTNITGILVEGATLYVLETDPTNVANTAMLSVSLP